LKLVIESTVKTRNWN